MREGDAAETTRTHAGHVARAALGWRSPAFTVRLRAWSERGASRIVPRQSGLWSPEGRGAAAQPAEPLSGTSGGASGAGSVVEGSRLAGV